MMYGRVFSGFGLFAVILTAVLFVLAYTKSGSDRRKKGGDASLFSGSYSEARQKFLDAARAAEATIESYRNPHTRPGGEPLAVDVALLGEKNARAVLMVISGTHGVEGFAGSAIQTGLLRYGIASRLEPDAALLLIHALNPYGFAHLRRFNEDNVDLNRNFVDHTTSVRRNRRYEELEEAISPQSISSFDNTSAILKLIWYRLRHGKAALKEAVTFGQYTDPDGLFYGGDSETWSNRTLREVVSRYLSRAERVASIEIHTGLGPFGGAEVILNEAAESPAGRRAQAWFGSLAKSTSSGESVSGEIGGSVKLALPAMLPKAEVTAVSLEFGTYSARKVLQALRRENWLHHHSGSDHPEAKRIKSDLLEAFYPDSEEWRAQVWREGQRIIDQAYIGLSRISTDPRR